MRIDKFTVKAQEAVQEGQGLARRASHGNYEPEHLLRALLDQQDGLATPMLQKIGASVYQSPQAGEGSQPGGAKPGGPDVVDGDVKDV